MAIVCAKRVVSGAALRGKAKGAARATLARTAQKRALRLTRAVAQGEGTFTSKIFDVEDVELAGCPESIVRGGRDKFGLLESAFEGVSTIGVVGWGSQGPAQVRFLFRSPLPPLCQKLTRSVFRPSPERARPSDSTKRLRTFATPSRPRACPTRSR